MKKLNFLTIFMISLLFFATPACAQFLGQLETAPTSI